MLVEIALAISMTVNAYLLYRLKTITPTTIVEERIIEREVGIPVCTYCPEQHRLDGPQWKKREFTVGSGEDGWARNWEGKDNNG